MPSLDKKNKKKEREGTGEGVDLVCMTRGPLVVSLDSLCCGLNDISLMRYYCFK